MAAQTYSVEDRNLTRVSCIYQKVATEVLRYVFQYGSSNRPHNMSLLDYYDSKGINSTKFRNRLFEEQRKKVDIDFRGDTFDITLLYRCLRCGSHGLGQEHDEKWNKYDKASIESLLTIIKNKRNHLAHEQPKYTNRQLINEAQNLKDELKQILRFSEHLFHIPTATIDQDILGVEAEVTKCLYDEFQPTTFEEYKKQLFFDAQSEFLKDEGVKDTMEQYEKCKEDEVNTTNHLVPLKLPVDDVYTEMKLKGKTRSGQDKSIAYKDVLKNRNKRVIVINGIAGVGKTTFMKKMIRDFKFDITTMKDLADHDHILKADCRDLNVKSFNDLLHHRMPNASKHFKAGDLEKVALAQKLLVILDGMDELNKASAQLFEELLLLKKTFGITLVITTRPEKMNDIEQKLKSHNLQMKHIEMLGVPTVKRDELVIKYHREIAKIHSGIQDISGLLKYLKDTEHRLAGLWRLPYNLTLLTIIWSYDFKDVTSIDTAPELYREILQLYRTKLKERLQSCESTRHLNGSKLDKIIDFFLYSLARESFIGLVNNHINLPQEAYERLEEVCGYLKIPTEEMISAFLKQVPSTDIIYGFAHKGLQDYLAAYYIWLEITGRKHNLDIQHILESETEFLLQKNVSPIVIRNTVRYLKGELIKGPIKKRKLVRTVAGTFGHLFSSLKTSSFIHSILENIHGSSNYNLPKFQNMFICLLGMFYSGKDVIDEDVKLEALMLLQGTGITDRDAWMTILNSVKCDEYVASFISKQPHILDGHIHITDSTVSAYISLMKSLKPHLKNSQKVKLDLDLVGDLANAHQLLHLISSHQFKVTRILITDANLKDYVAMLKALATPLKDAHDVKINISVTEELLDIRELVNLIEKKHFAIGQLQVKDFEINDVNLNQYISVFKSLSRLQEKANQTSVDINIKGDLTGTDELLGLISSCQFKLKRLLINDSNFMTYTTMLKNLTKPLKDANEVKVDICIDEDMATIRDLMREIKENRFVIEKFQVRDFQIEDSNLIDCISILRTLSIDWQEANKPSAHILIKGKLISADDILELIAVHKLKVKEIVITDENFRKYTTMLKNLKVPLKDAHEVNIDLQVKVGLPEIKELMQTISDKGFKIRKLELNTETVINDKNFIVYAQVLASLPTIEKQAFKGKISVYIENENSEMSAILKKIAEYQFAVEIRLRREFRHPESVSRVSEDALNSVFERCPIESYTGRMMPQASIPASMKYLTVCITDTPSYLQLRRFLDTDQQLGRLNVSVHLGVEVNELSPLPGDFGLAPGLLLPDVQTKEDAQKASKIAKKLTPITGNKKFEWVFFPRLRLKGEEIKYLVSEMKGVHIRYCVVLPTSCRPSSRDLERDLKAMARCTLQCLDIEWGKPGPANTGGIFDMDSW